MLSFRHKALSILKQSTQSFQAKNIWSNYQCPSIRSPYELSQLQMNFRYFFSTTKDESNEKTQEITSQAVKKNPKAERIKIVLNESDFEWSFVKGTGPGGQCVNKTSNCAVLIHKPTGIQVRSHASRELETNKHYCKKQLSEKLDQILNGENSKKSQKEQKKKKQDQRRKRKSELKYAEQNSKIDKKQIDISKNSIEDQNMS